MKFLFPSLTWERNNEIGLKPVKKYSFVSNLKNHMQLQGELTKTSLAGIHDA